MEGIHQNMQSFSSAGVLLNGSIFLSSFPKCVNHCQNKAHRQGHLKPGMALKPAVAEFGQGDRTTWAFHSPESSTPTSLFIFPS